MTMRDGLDHKPSRNLLAWLAFDAPVGTLELVHEQLRAQQWSQGTLLEASDRTQLLVYLGAIQDGQALPADVVQTWRALVRDGMHVIVALQAARDIHLPAAP